MDTLNKIIALLERKKLTQQDLIEYIGASRGTFTKWKTGENQSYKKHIAKIAEFLNVSTDYLLGTEIKKDSPYGLSESDNKYWELIENIEMPDLFF